MDASTARTLNIRALVAEAGGPTAFANVYGAPASPADAQWSQAQVSQWTSDDKPKGIGHKLAREIERRTGKPLGWLDQDHASKVAPAPFLRPITIWDDAEDLPPDQFVFFPSLEYRWSCGPGGPDHNAVEETDKSISFTAEWARKMGWSPKTHLTMRASGVSMEPTIQDKAPVVIDTSEAGRVIRSGKVYAIKVNGEPLLKRLDKLPGGRLRVRSDNQAKDYEPFEVAEGDIELVGRAVWTPVNL